jgi:sugar lactone lactonase YvrE
MKKIKAKAVIELLLILLIAIIALFILFVYLRFGGGREYIDVSSDPVYQTDEVELFFSYDEPIGNVAVTRNPGEKTRVFFTVHPESRPENNHLLEIVDGKAVPYPDQNSQDTLFSSPLGVFIDSNNWLWVIDHNNHAAELPRLTAFDLNTNNVVHTYEFPRNVAERFSFLNDISVSPDGQYVFIADVSFFAQNPSLIVYNVTEGWSRSVLDGHPSVFHQKYVPVTPAKKMSFIFGILQLLTGIDGIDVSHDGKYIYYAPMSGDSLYRIPVNVVTDRDLDDKDISAAVELVSPKPLSDGIRLDKKGNIYITDIEHQGVYVVSPEGKGFTLVKDQRIRWADGLSIAGDGYVYLADSDIPNQMLQSKKHIKQNSPYHIFRFKTVSE